MTQVTERFSSRVENYIRYRPSYPSVVIETLRAECGLTEASVVADVGSGTGILTEMFLRSGNRVYGVEPNREMREAGERLLAAYPLFRSVSGTAEATTLDPTGVDFVVAGQAFHWFDQNKARAEFRRILAPGGWVALVWNERQETTSPFAVAYEQLLQDFATDYNEVNHKQIDPTVLKGFFAGVFQARTFANRQLFDFDGVKGRLLSSSYAPEAGHPRHEPMLAELRRSFDAHQEDGHVAFDYDTNLYFGKLD